MRVSPEVPAAVRARERRSRPPASSPRQQYVAQLGLTVLLCAVALGFGHRPALPPVPATAPVQAGETSVPLTVVNKARPLVPATYVPPQLVTASGTVLVPEAAAALSAMIDAAAVEGVRVLAVSGYRSFDAQTRLYDGYTNSYGQVHTDALSARPGFSEHQTGLAVDIGNPDATCALQPCFAVTPAGSWAAANAARFGFIIRYPEGASAVTGYAYEPWHLRYVGPEQAASIVKSGLALEAYEGLPPAPSY